MPGLDWKYGSGTGGGASFGTPNFGPPSSGGGGNRPPTERVWEEEREDEPTVSVDYTTPTVDTSQPVNTGVDARSAHLKSEAEKSADKYLLGIGRAMQGMENAPLEIDPVTGQAIRAGGWKRDDPFTGGQTLYSKGSKAGPITGVGDKGALLSDWERMELGANQLGQGLGSMIATDDYGNPIFDSSGNVIYTGLGRAVKDDWGNIINAFAGEEDVSGQEYLANLEDQYWEERRSFDDWWYDDPGTPWGQEWYDYPLTHQESDKLPHWRSEALPTESVSMGEREQIYDRELNKERMASPLHMAGMESMTGIPYQGRPEFGTIKYGDDEFGSFVG
jgi:hypothetical protein